MSRIRYSAEVRQHALSLVLESRLPISRAALEAGCSANSIHYWLKRHRQKDTRIDVQQTEATFVPINVIDSGSNHAAEIVLPNGITLRLPDTTPQYLAELLQALVPSC